VLILNAIILCLKLPTSKNFIANLNRAKLALQSSKPFVIEDPACFGRIVRHDGAVRALLKRNGFA